MSQKRRLFLGTQSRRTRCSKPTHPSSQVLDIDDFRCDVALDDETISRALSRSKSSHKTQNEISTVLLEQWTGTRMEQSSRRQSLSTSSSDSLDLYPDNLPVHPSFDQGLSTDDNSSDDCFEKEEDYGVELERDLHLHLHASRLSQRLAVELAGPHPRPQVILPHVLLGHFRKFHRVLNVLATPERRILLQIIELSQDKTSYFGTLVQDYINFVKENKHCHSSSQDLLQTLRQFMTQMKAYLVQSSEINPPIESYISEDQIDPMMEKAMCKCLLKPLYSSVQSALHEFQVASKSLQILKENLAMAKAKPPWELGIHRTKTPNAHTIQKIRRKLKAMCSLYSPERKIAVLLKVCKLIYNTMQNDTGKNLGADDFLPMLTYVLAQCNLPRLETEILYVMELIDPTLLHGEGGYYLTSVYGALSLIKEFQEEQSAGIFSSSTRDTLHQWHQRRTLHRNLPSVEDFQSYLRVALQQEDCGCTAKTLKVEPYATTEEVCRLCALKFSVPDSENYSLFLVTGDISQQLATDTCPQWIKAELLSRSIRQPFDFVYKKLPNIISPSSVF